MEIKEFEHKGVSKDGIIEGGGAVRTKAWVGMGYGEGCGLEGCNCSNGYWITIASPRTKEGTVKGMQIKFTDKKEMDKFLKTRSLEA
jgi:hypothetical protein